MNQLNVLRPGAAERKKLDGLQAQVASLLAEIDAVQRASLALAEARLALVREIERSPGADGYAFVSAVCGADNRYAGPFPALNWGTVAVLFDGGVDELADRIIARTFARHGYKPGLPRAEREARIEQLRADLYKVEVAEETEVVALERAGHVIVRRPDANITALLEVWSAIGASAESTAAVAA